MTKPSVIDFEAVVQQASTIFAIVIDGLATTFQTNLPVDSAEITIAQVAAVRAADETIREGLEGYELDLANAVAKQLLERMAAATPALIEAIQAKESPIEVVDQTHRDNTSFTNRVLEILRTQLLPVVNHATRTADDDDQYTRLAYAVASMALAEQLLTNYDDKVRDSAPKLAKAFQVYLKDKEHA